MVGDPVYRVGIGGLRGLGSVPEPKTSSFERPSAAAFCFKDAFPALPPIRN